MNSTPVFPQRLLTLLVLCNLKQRNTITNASGRLLDLVLSDVRCEVSEDLSAIVNIDAHHPALLIDITAKSASIDNFPHKNVKHYNFRKCDFLSLYNSLLEVDWGVLDGISDVNTFCDTFYTIIYSLFDAHVPLKKLYSLFHNLNEMFYNNVSYTYPQGIVDIFANFFSSVFGTATAPYHDQSDEVSLSNCIDVGTITEIDVLNAIKKLGDSPSTGDDQPAKLLVQTITSKWAHVDCPSKEAQCPPKEEDGF
ncbi:hypothetical protein QE152_g25991 [Popillia japonica]|uniref:Uncharacterized protein n=1 Tax=Popillia japonica TaxID=7064 RepID=A0AAW1JZQ2_POPJA